MTIRKSLINNKRIIFITVIGNILEWYDFTVFAFLAPSISHIFFHPQDPIAALIKTFGIFAVGYLIRPLSGFFFGHIGDKWGRNRTLQLSIFMMAIPTVLIGFVPVYAQVGLLAPIILIVLRIIQGIAAGGELMGSVSYMFEIAPPKKQGYWASWVAASSMTGVLTGSLIVAMLHMLLPIHALLTWGWRIPFYFGAALAILGIVMRLKLKETPMFLDIAKKSKKAVMPILDAFKNEFKAIIKVILINVFISIAFYVLFVWMPSYVRVFLGHSAFGALMINTIIMGMLILLVPLAGKLSDKIGWKKQALIGVLLILVLTYPLFLLIISNSLWGILTAGVIFAVCMSLVDGALFAIMANLFSTKVRYSGLAIGYNLSTAIFGGTAPLLCTYFIHETGSLMIPAFFVIFASIISLPAFFSVRSKRIN